jgi:hypothetical protein
MKKVLIFAAIGEFATGVAVLIAPLIVARLLLGQDLTGAAFDSARDGHRLGRPGDRLLARPAGCWNVDL